jgi:hypothetical protein
MIIPSKTAVFFLALAAPAAMAFTTPNVYGMPTTALRSMAASSSELEVLRKEVSARKIPFVLRHPGVSLTLVHRKWIKLLKILLSNPLSIFQFNLYLQLDYKPGEADTDFAKKYKHLAGAKIKTVGESFAEFTKELGFTVNPLYKNMVTDIVGTTHLVVVNARFQQDAIWSLGMITALDLLLKNYPEQDVAAKIQSSLFKSVGLDEAKIVAEAKAMQEWAQSKTRAEIESALDGEGDSPVAQIARSVKDDPFWMYSRYFGIGLVKMMSSVGIEMDKDEVYPVMEDWMSKKLGKGHITACVRIEICMVSSL